MRYTPLRCTSCEVHACEVHAHEVYGPEVHVYGVYAHEVHAREMHVHDMHRIYDHKVHAHETPAHHYFDWLSRIGPASSQLQKSQRHRACSVPERCSRITGSASTRSLQGVLRRRSSQGFVTSDRQPSAGFVLREFLCGALCLAPTAACSNFLLPHSVFYSTWLN
jgi:hypothetical protein